MQSNVLTPKEYLELIEALKESTEIDSKFVDTVFKLKTGENAASANGLADRMCILDTDLLKSCANGVQGIKDEIKKFVVDQTKILVNRLQGSDILDEIKRFVEEEIGRAKNEETDPEFEEVQQVTTQESKPSMDTSYFNKKNSTKKMEEFPKQEMDPKIYEEIRKQLNTFVALSNDPTLKVREVGALFTSSKISNEYPKLQELDQKLKDIGEVGELLEYVCYSPTSEKKYPNGIRDEGKPGMRLQNFLEIEKAKNLDEAEVVALRLYTTMIYKFLNEPLRDNDRFSRSEACPLPVTTYFASTGIKKLRALKAEEKKFPTLWRGMRNVDAPKEFLENGGTELPFMSTTQDLSVAVRYSLSPYSLLFKLVPDNHMVMGADVQWLSAFAGEKEILYPPLTFLQPGRKQIIEVNNRKVTIIEIKANPGS